MGEANLAVGDVVVIEALEVVGSELSMPSALTGVDCAPGMLGDMEGVETGEVAPYYRAADIALCTSRIESYPRVILEAMACGLPVIATPVFGISEQVRENVNGIFYKPGDAGALAAALAELVENDARRLQFGAQSAAVLASLTGFEEMLDGYGRVFREARCSRGRPWFASRSHAVD